MAHETDTTSRETYTVVLGERGRIVLPAEIRGRLHIQPGDRLIITVDDKSELHIVTARELARRGVGLFKDLAPGRSLVDELIAERREEARREDEE